MLEARNGNNGHSFTTNGLGETSRRPDGLIIPEHWSLRVPHDLRQPDHSFIRYFASKGYKYRVELEVQDSADDVEIATSKIIPQDKLSLEVLSRSRKETTMGNALVRGYRQAFDGLTPRFREGDADPYFLERINQFAQYRQTNGKEGMDIPLDMVDFILHPQLDEFMKKMPAVLIPLPELSERVRSEIEGLEADPMKLGHEYPISKISQQPVYRYIHKPNGNGNGRSPR